MRQMALVAVLLGSFALTARADVEDNFVLDFGLGYSKLNIEGDFVEELDGTDTVAVNFRFMFADTKPTNLRIGFALNAVGVYEETEPFLFDGEAFLDDPFKEFSMIVPQFVIGYNIPLGDSGWFIEPRIGIGPAIGYFRAGEDRGEWWDDDNEYEERWEVNIAFQPAIQLGYMWDHFGLGVEAAYLWTHLDFDDDIGGDITQFYAGGFFRWSF